MSDLQIAFGDSIEVFAQHLQLGHLLERQVSEDDLKENLILNLCNDNFQLGKLSS